MPSQTYHLKREHMDYLDSLCDENESLSNPSQALKFVINQHRQKQSLGESDE